MRTYFSLTLAVASMLNSAPSFADTLVEAFDSGTNRNGWTWGFGDTLQTSGGHPNGYLRTDGLDTYAPQPRPTAPNSPYVGDYRAAGVTCIGIDLITYHVDFSAGGRPLTLMLIDDNGTPDVFEDDTAAYFMHAQNVPLEGQGWMTYDFTVPSDQSQLPSGWLLLNLGDSGSPPIHSWNQVIQHVSNMQFFYGDPTFFFIFQQWVLGLDNARICVSPPLPCPADVSPAPAGNGVVNIDDLLTVIGAWNHTGTPGTMLGDVTGNGVVNIDDLLAVISAWGGCP